MVGCHHQHIHSSLITPSPSVTNIKNRETCAQIEFNNKTPPTNITTLTCFCFRCLQLTLYTSAFQILQSYIYIYIYIYIYTSTILHIFFFSICGICIHVIFTFSLHHSSIFTQRIQKMRKNCNLELRLFPPSLSDLRPM